MFKTWKSLVVLSLVLGLAISVGCQQAAQEVIGTPPASYLEANAAADIAKCLAGVTQMDDIFSGLSVSGGVSVQQTAEADNWYVMSGSVTTPEAMDYEMHFKALKNSAPLDLPDYGDMDELWLYAIFTGSSAEFKIGTGQGAPFDSGVPFKATGLQIGGDPKLNGTVSATATVSGDTIGISLTYDNLSVADSGYPTGSVAFTITCGTSTIYKGTIVFNGTDPDHPDIATITFTTGGTGSYTVDLDTGVVTPV